MPSLTQSFAKKRRRSEEDDGSDIRLTFPQDFHEYYSSHPYDNHGPSSRKSKPFSSPLTKKIRIATTAEWVDGEEPYIPLSPPRPTSPPLPSSRHPHSHLTFRSTNKAVSPPKITANVLAPCHICHRKPTKKTELDSYADCEGCGERTCYICIRACLGWKGGVLPATEQYRRETAQEDIMKDENQNENWDQEECLDQSFAMEDAPTDDDGSPKMKREESWGKGGGTGHRGRICSQCCVEEGPEGEVICLGCLGT